MSSTVRSKAVYWLLGAVVAAILILVALAFPLSSRRIKDEPERTLMHSSKVLDNPSERPQENTVQQTEKSIENTLARVDEVWERMNEDPTNAEKTFEMLVDEMERSAGKGGASLHWLALASKDPKRSLVQRQAVLVALGRVDFPESRHAILEAIVGRGDSALRQIAIFSLYQAFGTQDRVRLTGGDPPNRKINLPGEVDSFLEALAKTIHESNEGQPIVFQGLKSIAVQALINLCGTESVRNRALEMATQLLSSQDEFVTAPAVKELAKYFKGEGSDTWFRTQLLRLGDSTSSQLVREQIALVIAEKEPQRAVDFAARGLTDPDVANRFRTIHVLEALGVAPDVLLPVFKKIITQDPSTHVRIEGLKALGGIRVWSDSFRDLVYEQALDKEHDEVRAAAIEAYGKRGLDDRAKSLVFDALHDGSGTMAQLAAARALGDLPSIYAAEIRATSLTLLSGDGPSALKIEILRALSRYGSKEDIPALESLSSSSQDESIKLAIKQAVEQIRTRSRP